MQRDGVPQASIQVKSTSIVIALFRLMATASSLFPLLDPTFIRIWPFIYASGPLLHQILRVTAQIK